jgi:hypothetical protein
VPDEAVGALDARSVHDDLQIPSHLDGSPLRAMARHGSTHPSSGIERREPSEGRARRILLQPINRRFFLMEVLK